MIINVIRNVIVISGINFGLLVMVYSLNLAHIIFGSCVYGHLGVGQFLVKF